MESLLGDPDGVMDGRLAVLDAGDRAAVDRMQTVAWALDDAVRVPGTNRRIGIDPIVGILPIAGDLATAAASMYIVAQSARLDVERRTLGKMVANVAVDAGAGSIPVAGDLFDAAWKANKRNVALAVADLTPGDGRRTADDEQGPRAVPVDIESADGAGSETSQ